VKAYSFENDKVAQAPASEYRTPWKVHMTRWSKSRRIANHNASAKPGLYIIFNQKAVQRIRKKDPLGILYIGESKNLWKGVSPGI